MVNNVMPVGGTVRTATATGPSSSLQQESIRPAAPMDGMMSSTAERPRRTASSASIWRPWTPARRNKPPPSPYSRPPPPPPPSAPGCSDGQMKAHCFQHPVRLMWPLSKTFDFLYSDGATLLRNFPVQATICFYQETDSEDDSDDDEEEEEEEDKCTKSAATSLRHTQLNCNAAFTIKRPLKGR